MKALIPLLDCRTPASSHRSVKTMARSIGSPRSLVLAVLAGLANSLPAQTAAPANPPAPRPALQPAPAPGEMIKVPEVPKDERLPVRERERTVYVPFEELEKVFQDGGRGVFLPYREFLELWNELTLKREEKDKPPADGVVSKAEYTGRVEGNTLVLDARITLESFRDGWISLPLGAADMAGIGEAQTGKAVLQSTTDGHKILIPGKGVHEITLKLFAPVVREQGKSRAKLSLPRAAVSRLTALVDGEGLEFEVKPAAAFTTRAAGAGQTELSFFFGSGASHEVAWGAPQGAGTLTPLLLADSQITASIGAGSIATKAAVTYNIMRAPVSEFRIGLPAGQEVLSVTGADVKDWSLAPGDAGRQRLTITPNKPVKDSYSIELQIEGAMAGAGEVAVPDLVIEGASYARGRVLVQSEPQLDVTEKALQAAVRSNASRDKPADGHMHAGAFRLLAQPWKITLAVAEARPQVEVTSLTKLEVLRETVRVEAQLDYQIRRVGIFEARAGLPAGLSVATVTGSGIGEWNVEAGAAGQTLVVKLPEQKTGALQLKITGRQVRAKADEDVTAPVITPQNVARHEAKVGVAVHSSLEVNTKSPGDFQQEDVSALGSGKSAAPGLETVLAFRYRDAAKPAVLGFKGRDPQVSVEVLTLVEAREQGTRHQWTLAFDVAYAAVDRFVLAVPKSVANEVRLVDPLVKQTNRTFTPDPQKYKNLDTANNAYWEVELRNEKLGAFQLALSHDKQGALEAGKTGKVEVLQVHVPGAFQETGQIAVTKDDSLEIRNSAPESLEEIDSRELHAALQKGGVFLALKYRQPPFKLAFEVAKNDYFAVPQAVITHADLTTAVATDRAQSTEVIYWVKNIDMQFLVVRLPKGASLVSDVFVRGESQQPMRREGSEDLLVRLPSGSGTERSAFPVRFVYQMPSPEPGVKLGWLGSLEVLPPSAAEVKVFETRHRLFLPEEWHYTKFHGPLTQTMRERGWLRARRVIDPLIPAFGPQASRNNDWQWDDPPAVASEVRSLYDFPVPAQGHAETLRRLGPPDRIEASFRSRKLSTLAESVAFLLVTLAGVSCLRCSLRGRLMFVVIFGVGAVLLTGLLGAVNGRVAIAVILAVGLVIGIWLVVGALGVLRGIGGRLKGKSAPPTTRGGPSGPPPSSPPKGPPTAPRYPTAPAAPSTPPVAPTPAPMPELTAEPPPPAKPAPPPAVDDDFKLPDLSETPPAENPRPVTPEKP